MLLSRKILIATISIIFLTAVALTFVSFQRLHSQTWSSLTHSMTGMSESSAAAMSEWFSAKQTALLAANKAITRQPDAHEAILSHLLQAKEGADFVASYFGLEDGNMYRDSGFNTVAGFDPRVRDWYTKAMPVEGLITTDPFISAATGLLNVAVAQRVSVNNRVLGVVGGGVGTLHRTQGVLEGRVAEQPGVLVVRQGQSPLKAEAAFAGPHDAGVAVEVGHRAFGDGDAGGAFVVFSVRVIIARRRRRRRLTLGRGSDGIGGCGGRFGHELEAPSGGTEGAGATALVVLISHSARMDSQIMVSTAITAISMNTSL